MSLFECCLCAGILWRKRDDIRRLFGYIQWERLRERAKRVRGPKDLGGRRRTAGFQARNAKLANALFFFFLSYLPPLQLGNDLYGFFSPKTFFFFL